MCFYTAQKNQMYNYCHLEKEDYEVFLPRDQKKLMLRCEKKRFRQRNDFNPESVLRKYHHRRHQERVCAAQTTLDTRMKLPPNVFRGNYFLYNKRIPCLVKRQRSNTFMAWRIRDALIRPSQIDNHLDPTVYLWVRKTGIRRLGEQLKLTRKNVRLEKILENTKTSDECDRAKLSDWYKHMEGIMERFSRYPLYWKDYVPTKEEAMAMNRARKNKYRVYFDFEVTNEEIGRVTIELNPKACPLAVDQFHRMCLNQCGPHSFVCKRMHKMWPGSRWCIGRGARGYAKYTFPPERKRMKHDQKGVISLVNNGFDKFDAEFIITAKELPPLDGRNLAIGKVVDGMEYLESLERHLLTGFIFAVPVFIAKTGTFNPDGEPPPAPQMKGACKLRCLWDTCPSTGFVVPEEEEEEEDEEEEEECKDLVTSGEPAEEEEEETKEEEDEDKKCCKCCKCW